jgi:thioredoxin-related protein
MERKTESQINWLQNLDEAYERAEMEGKVIFLDFFNPGWGGCKKMGAVTYPDDRVAKLINENFVPVQINVVDHPEFTDQFHAHWTPSIIYLDPEGTEHLRWYGYVTPDDLIVDIHMALAQIAFDNKQYDEAVQRYEQVVSEYPDSDRAPQALYMVGTSRYRVTGDPSNLENYWDQVIERYPGTRWAKAGDI